MAGDFLQNRQAFVSICLVFVIVFLELNRSEQLLVWAEGGNEWNKSPVPCTNVTHIDVTQDSSILITANVSDPCNISVSVPSEKGLHLDILQASNWTLYEYIYVTTDEQEKCWDDKDIVAFTEHPGLCSIRFDSKNFEINVKASILMNISLLNLNKDERMNKNQTTELDNENSCCNKSSLEYCNMVESYDSVFYVRALNISIDQLLANNNALNTTYKEHYNLKILGSVPEYVYVVEMPAIPPECQTHVHHRSFEAHCPLANISTFLIYEQIYDPSIPCALNVSRRNAVHISSEAFESLHSIQYLLFSHNRIETVDGVFHGLESLKVLDLSDNILESLLGNVFSGILSLQQLYLQRNILHTLSPGVFNNLFSLQVLNLEQNKITSVASSTQNLSIFNDLHNLKILNLNANLLLSLEGNSFQTLHQLCFLNLNRNQLPNLPTGIFESQENLRGLWLDDNDLSELLPHTFQQLENLSILSLQNDYLTTLHDNAFVGLGNLTELNLNDNLIIKLNINVFKYLKKLSVLHLHGNQLEVLKSGLFDDLLDLESLWLHNNYIVEIQLGLFKRLHKLRRLLLNSNYLEVLLPGLFDSLGNLTELDLSDNMLTELDVNLFQTLHKLSILSLHTNQLRQLKPGIFDRLSNLTELWLYENHLTELDGNIFQSLQKLSLLVMHTNQLKDLKPGIFDSLSNLTQLWLSKNQLTELDANIFQGLHKLSVLSMKSNQLRQLKPGIFDNCVHLTELWLYENHLTELDGKIFNNLNKLNILLLHENQLRDLKPGIFDSLGNLTDLWLFGNQLTELDVKVFQSLHKLPSLVLYANQLRELKSGMFDSLGNLTEVWLYENQLTALDANIFQRLYKLSILGLHKNQLRELKPGIFDSLGNLTELSLYENHLTELDINLFQGLHKLSILSLYNNYLTLIKPDTFYDQSQLSELHLNDNSISVLSSGLFLSLRGLKRLEIERNNLSNLQPGVFKSLGNLSHLWLHYNKLTQLSMNVFQGLLNLEYLTLSGNGLTYLESFTFQHLESLLVLKMGENKLLEIQKDAFKGNLHLQLVDLTFNPLGRLTYDSLSELENNTTISVDSEAVCKCIIHQDKGPRCAARKDLSPYLSCEPLLYKEVIRLTVWLLGLSIIVANSVVIFWGCVQLRKEKTKRDEVKQKLLIVNLAAADLLMGLYLLILGAVDNHYGTYFPFHAEKWRTSLLCKFSAVLSVLSSEASLFFLTLISFDRFWSLKNISRQNLLHTRMSRVIATVAIWALAIVLSTIPLGLDDEDFEFSQVCIGLPIARRINFHTEREPLNVSLTDSDRVDNISFQTLNVTGTSLAPYYSISLFLGVNFFCCVSVAICYISIFSIIIYTRTVAHLTMNVSRWRREVRTALKMGIIVITDFVCWMPIIIIGILVQTEYTELSPTTYAWVIAFALPINSAVNPFLYAIGQWISNYYLENKKRTQREDNIPMQETRF
ncbi:uncharacterized protein [Amphiura filiformis]|uniref:uncharacterized protein n=1 Tax=Amphiura filiformis TaxID=82378 RepID=UPI003B210D84